MVFIIGPPLLMEYRVKIIDNGALVEGAAQYKFVVDWLWV